MTSTNTEAVIKSLKLMQDTLHQLHALLSKDQQYFRNNDLTNMGISNTEKAKLLSVVSEEFAHLSKLTASKPGSGIFEILDRINTNTDNKEIAKLADDLKVELTACYSELTINSRVVYTTIQYIKNTWNKLISYKSDMNCVYNNKGSINK